MEFPSNIWFNVKLRDAVRLVLKKHRDHIPAIWKDKAGFVIASIKQDDIKKVLDSITRGVVIDHSGKTTCTVTDTTIVLPCVAIDIM